MKTSQYVIIVHAPAHEGLTSTLLSETRDALDEYANGPLADHHGCKCSFRVSYDVNDRKPEEYAIHLVESIPDAPGALAYHYVVDGRPDIVLGLIDCEMSLTTSDGLPWVLSHEVAEAEGDPGANEWVDAGGGKQRAKELCDRVQNIGFATSKGAMVSDFLLREAFIPGAPGPWDYVSLVWPQRSAMADQLDYSNGYDIEREPNGTEKQLAAMGTKPVDLDADDAKAFSTSMHGRYQLSVKALRRKHRVTSRALRRLYQNATPAHLRPGYQYQPDSPGVDGAMSQLAMAVSGSGEIK